MIGMVEVGLFWQDFCVVLEMVSNSWEVKQLDTQLQTLFRLVVYIQILVFEQLIKINHPLETSKCATLCLIFKVDEECYEIYFDVNLFTSCKYTKLFEMLL